MWLPLAFIKTLSVNAITNPAPNARSRTSTFSPSLWHPMPIVHAQRNKVPRISDKMALQKFAVRISFFCLTKKRCTFESPLLLFSDFSIFTIWCFSDILDNFSYTRLLQNKFKHPLYSVYNLNGFLIHLSKFWFTCYYVKKPEYVEKSYRHKINRLYFLYMGMSAARTVWDASNETLFDCKIWYEWWPCSLVTILIFQLPFFFFSCWITLKRLQVFSYFFHIWIHIDGILQPSHKIYQSMKLHIFTPFFRSFLKNFSCQ